MTDYPGLPYKELIRDAIKNDLDTQIKKRRRLNSPEVIEIQDSTPSAEPESDSDDFEDVALNLTTEIASEPDEKEPLKITLNPIQNEKSPVKRVIFISKAEREYRKQIHKQSILLQIIHGALRNRWLNDYSTGQELKKLIPSTVLTLIDQDAYPDNDLVKSRRFLDALQKILKIYSSKFRTISQGLIRKEWDELSLSQPNTESVSFAKFKRLVKNYRGSRDIGAQGFVSLLRSIGLNARLIFSLQPPDFTNISYSPAKATADEENIQKDNKDAKSTSNTRIQGSHNSKSRLLFHNRSNFKSITPSNKSEARFIDSSFPIFWVEVWNKYSQKWVSIDPVVNQILEYVSLRSKSKFEPPLTDTRNQLTYVIAFDRLGGVRDVTRRYSKLLNAKTSKKRIGAVSDSEKHWYDKILRCSSSMIRRNLSKLDILELKEFHNRDLAEGMPNNLSDFKNHPTYVLESQLRKNEILYPKEECGSFRTGRGNSSQPVYKRSNVHQLKSSRAWYMRGRILRVGEQPMRIRQNPKLPDDENEVRLYCEFQTQLYNPPRIENGTVPKNAYGNIDVYVPSMLPENGVLLSNLADYPITIMEKAAKLLNIDYAKAIVAFDFSGKKKVHGVPKVKEGGIVIYEGYKEAMMLALEELAENERDELVEKAKMNSLNNWKFFLLRLRISQRLDKMHGKVDEIDDIDEVDDDEDDDEEEEEYETYEEEYDNDDEDEYENEDEQYALEAAKSSAAYNLENIPEITHIVADNNRSEEDKVDHSIDNMSVDIYQDNDSTEDEDSMGGFLLDDETNSNQVVQVDAKSEEESEIEDDLPDELFTEDEGGELVYAPNRDNSNATNRDDVHPIIEVDTAENFDFDYSESD